MFEKQYKPIVFSSSVTVYGNAIALFNETAPLESELPVPMDKPNIWQKQFFKMYAMPILYFNALVYGTLIQLERIHRSFRGKSKRYS